MPNITSQECGRCIYATKCYSETTTTRNRVLNILACRIKNDIDRDKASRLFLTMIKPNIMKLIHYAVSTVGTGYINVDEMLMNLNSRTVEALIDTEKGYRIGEPCYLTEWLFATHHNRGWMRKWILWEYSKQRRFYTKHKLSGHNPRSDIVNDISAEERVMVMAAERYATVNLDDSSEDFLNIVRDIINDGYTLNINEFRVFSFCLRHANESNKVRLIDGMHMYLSKIMGVSRPRVTKLFSTAKDKVVQATRERNAKIGG